jgi:hypothetical protein
MGLSQPGPGLKDRMDTGFSEDLDTHQMLERARKVVHDAAQGHGVQVPPGVPPKFILNEIYKAQKQYNGSNPGLQQLEQMVRQSAAKQQPGPQQPPPKRPQQPPPKQKGPPR